MREIQLYEDDPEQCLYYDMLNLMYPFIQLRYHRHENILKEITTTIETAFDAFYHPAMFCLSD